MNGNADHGCWIQDKLFSNFTFQVSATGGAVPVAAGNVSVVTIASVLSVGFSFTFSLNAGPTQDNDLNIGYTVTGPNITNNQLSMTGGWITGGEAAVFETYCMAAAIPCGGGTSGSLQVYSISGVGSIYSAGVSGFGPVTTLGVNKDIIVDGLGLGFAHISNITETVDQVSTPEPASQGLIGLGLLGLVGVFRPRKIRA
jgi:hypothetical protein